MNDSHILALIGALRIFSGILFCGTLVVLIGHDYFFVVVVVAANVRRCVVAIFRVTATNFGHIDAIDDPVMWQSCIWRFSRRTIIVVDLIAAGCCYARFDASKYWWWWW